MNVHSWITELSLSVCGPSQTGCATLSLALKVSFYILLPVECTFMVAQPVPGGVWVEIFSVFSVKV